MESVPYRRPRVVCKQSLSHYTKAVEKQREKQETLQCVLVGVGLGLYGRQKGGGCGAQGIFDQCKHGSCSEKLVTNSNV